MVSITWFLVVLNGYNAVVLSGCNAVVLTGSQWLPEDLKGSRWLSVVLNGFQ